MSRDYSLHNREGIEESSASNQPLYMDRMQDSFCKGRYQRGQQAKGNKKLLKKGTPRGRSPSPQAGGRISPLKNTWNVPVTIDMQKHLCSGVQEISVGAPGSVSLIYII
ncbi:hypothetical protein E2C01_055026 [Portunus trituberculatus]|uniref:Uncharacterized protein n=1 Tax=Portunus trituberculatus TaxID=210409 RepID=A0A5B7GWI5_PORTR|nr:hypothetical protein [Portunus trituberculatus]